MQGLENNNIDLKNLPSTPLYPLKKPILTPEQLEQKKKDLIVDLNQKSKELTELGLLDELGGFVGYQTDNAKEREKQLTEIKTQALDNKIEFKDLPNALKDDYYNKAETSILNPLKTKNEIAKQDYQKDLQRKAILQKKSQELTESDKELIAHDSGFFNNALDAITGKSEVEKLKEFKEKEKAKDITKEIQKAYSAFSNIDKNKDFFSLFSSPDKEAQEKAKQDFETIAKNLYHFDSVIYNEKNEPFVIKGDKAYKINDGFIDNFTQSLLNNKFSLAGSVAGGITGAKYGKSVGALGLVGGAIAGAALGATAGAASDAIITNLALDRENKADEIIRHALSEGALSLATDTIMLGAGKAIKPLVKAPLKLAEMSMPFQFTKNFLTGNTKRASEIIENTLSKEQQEALKEFSAQFGGETKINQESGKDFLRDKIKSVFKGDENKLKAYDKVKEILTLDNHKEQQQAFIRAIRSDETGNTLAFLIEAANLSPKANANLKSILNQTTENLTKSLKQVDLKDYEIKSVFDNLEQGTKESYDKALNEIIGKLYDDSYKVNLRESVQDISNFEKFLNDLKAQGEIDVQAKSFLRQIEENVYNPNGVTYEQLKNSRQLINAYLRNVKDPSTLGYIQKASANFLKNDIDNAIENLLKQNKSAYKKISELQKSAISDYRDMKQALELVDKAKMRDKITQESDAINSLMKIIKGQGKKDLSNYQALTKGLQESDKERLELSMLNRLMEQSLKQDESVKVFDSAQFFNKLSEFKGEVFTTPKANQYIDIAKGFDKLFRNDATIAGKINYTTTKDIKSPLATSLEGAFNQKLTQRLVGTIVRNIPTTYIFKKLDELSGGAALKYHIQRALERSHTISEFSKRLELSAKNSKFSNATMRKIEEITQGVKSAKESITKQEKALKDAITPLKQFGKNYAEFVLKPKEALEKLLQEKNGQVAGAAFRDDLGGIDFVWGKDGKDGYGLAHILEKREKQYTRLGLNAEQIKERTDELLKSIPEVIENGALFKDDLGRVSVELNHIKVGLKNTWDNNNLNNHFVVTSYERDEKVLRELETKPPLSNDYKDNSNYSALNLNESNPTKESLTSQEPPLSILEKSQLEKQKKLQSERLAKAEKERAQKIKDKEEAELRDKIRAQKNAMLGKSELDREIFRSENIPYKELKNAPKTSVSLNDDEIHPLKFVIVNRSDLKPNFKNTGTQTRTAVDSKKVEEIAKRFDPKLIIGRGGFDDLPIILQDGQIIAGNHRIQGMLNFNAESRKKYEQAIKENFNIELKPDELLVRMPKQELNDKEIFKLAGKSNENRANSFSDTLLSAMSSYTNKLKHLAPKFESDSVENLANQVARALEKDAKIPSNTQVENANLALLSHYARNTPNNSFLEVFGNAYKNLDREQFKAFKEMFAFNSANFHNLNNDTMIKNFTISPYLTDALDTSAKMLESGNRSDNFAKLA
ncbi:DUF3519 domain-containing protein [Helicobacter pylori]|uniref:putative barnase/colicin E5 family endoribonuclease n=2 Tax=Helicobacter pylori TaxID=210 RepID=UPI00026B4CCF|nr:DUF3519 domain-containing protein [Helicobacter pylori]EJC16850.1 hypothetical protein HPHPP74_1674 [Helicobacter pylori Hp P-74]WQV31715.1 DUF3519 domain-containing protein [Helicobacter pylori]